MHTPPHPQTTRDSPEEQLSLATIVPKWTDLKVKVQFPKQTCTQTQEAEGTGSLVLQLLAYGMQRDGMGWDAIGQTDEFTQTQNELKSLQPGRVEQGNPSKNPKASLLNRHSGQLTPGFHRHHAAVSLATGLQTSVPGKPLVPLS